MSDRIEEIRAENAKEWEEIKGCLIQHPCHVEDIKDLLEIIAEKDAENERLKKELADLYPILDDLYFQSKPVLYNLCVIAEERAEEAERKLAEAEGRLRPIVECYEKHKCDHLHDWEFKDWPELMKEHFLAFWQAIKAAQDGGEEK
jgi:hypothetical protein